LELQRTDYWQMSGVPGRIPEAAPHPAYSPDFAKAFISEQASGKRPSPKGEGGLPAEPWRRRASVRRMGGLKRSQIRALQELPLSCGMYFPMIIPRPISPERCLRGSVQATRPGSIVVFHDSVKAEKNMCYCYPVS